MRLHATTPQPSYGQIAIRIKTRPAGSAYRFTLNSPQLLAPPLVNIQFQQICFRKFWEFLRKKLMGWAILMSSNKWIATIQGKTKMGVPKKRQTQIHCPLADPQKTLMIDPTRKAAKQSKTNAESRQSHGIQDASILT